MKLKYIFFIAFLIGQFNLALCQVDSNRFFKTTKGALIYDPYFSIGTGYSWDGQIKNGYAEGEGTCSFLIEDEEIALLTGMFSKGQATGECTFIDKYLENEIKCNFTSGRMLGIGTLLNTYNSDLYTGELRDLTIHGIGKMVYSNGSVFDGSFKNGIYWTGSFLDLNDKISFFYQQERIDSLPKYSKYSPILNQEVTEYFDDNWRRCKKNEASYYRKITYSKPNIPTGEIKEFYISGNLLSKYFASYVDYNDENLTFYSHGGIKVYNENGNLDFEHDYNYKGLYEGLYKSYHDNGTLKIKCYYIDGMISGNKLDYDDKGVLTHYAVYENGGIQDGKYYSYKDNLWTGEYDENFKNNFSYWDPKDKNINTSILDEGSFYANFEETGYYIKTKENVIDKDLQFRYVSEISTLKKEYKKDAYVGFIFDYKNNDNYAYIWIDKKLKVNFIKIVEGETKIFGETYQLKLSPEEKKSNVLNFNLYINFFYDGITFYINNQEVNFLKKWDWIGNESGVMAYGDISFAINTIHTTEFYDSEASQKFNDYLEKNVLNDDFSAQDSGYDSQGTGFFISDDGFIVTNFHVIEDAKIIDIQLNVNGKIEKYGADVVVSDKINDLAILKIISKDFKMDKGVPYGLQFGSEDVGSEVFTMGYPLADVMGNEIKFTDGKISSKSGINGDIRMYQISTPIQPGNSGGPLFNSNGNVVGIVSATLNRENYNSENVNYAIKSNILKNLIDSSPEKITIKELSIEDKSTISDKIKSYQSFIPMVLIKL